MHCSSRGFQLAFSGEESPYIALEKDGGRAGRHARTNTEDAVKEVNVAPQHAPYH